VSSITLNSDTAAHSSLNNFTHLSGSPTAAQILGQHFERNLQGASTLGEGMRTATNPKDEMGPTPINTGAAVTSTAGGSTNGG